MPLLLSLFLACAPPAPPPAAPPQREVSVSATARINVAPDEATIHLTFSATATGMKKSHTASGAAVQAFKTAVLALGVSPDMLELCGTTDNPNYRWDSSNRVVSYTSTTLLNVRTTDFEQVADIVDTAVANGVTAVDVEYHSTKMPEHKKHARELALVAAREKAEQLATGSGAKVGPILTVSEGTPTSRYGYAFGNSFGNNVAQTEISESVDADGAIAPGTTPLELTVVATYALE